MALPEDGERVVVDLGKGKTASYWIENSDEPGYALVHVTTTDGRNITWQVPQERSP